MTWYASLRQKWRKWRSLAEDDRRWLWQAMSLLLLVTPALRVLGFGRTSAVLGRLARLMGGGVRDSSADEVVRKFLPHLAHLVRIAAANIPLRAPCLPQALVLWFLIRRRGVDSELRVGVRRRQGRLEAHAWVECRGLNFLEQLDDQGCFLPFARPLTPTSPEVQRSAAEH